MKSLLTGRRGLASIAIVVLVVLGIVTVAVVAGAVVLSNDVIFTVNNNSCGPLNIAEGSAALQLNFLPGLNLPSVIEQGETATIQLPKTLLESVTVNLSSIDVLALGQTYSIGTSSLDLDQSTLDGTPLASLVGSSIDLSMDHAVDLACK